MSVTVKISTLRLRLLRRICVFNRFSSSSHCWHSSSYFANQSAVSCSRFASAEMTCVLKMSNCWLKNVTRFVIWTGSLIPCYSYMVINCTAFPANALMFSSTSSEMMNTTSLYRMKLSTS